MNIRELKMVLLAWIAPLACLAQDALICELSADQKTADVSFAVSSVERELYFAYGNSDGKDEFSKWDKVECVAEVAAGASEIKGLLVSDEFGTTYRIMRALLKSPPVGTSADYAAPESMLAQWDGIDNAGVGQHDDQRAYPVELKNGLEMTLEGTMTSTPNSFLLGNGYLHFNSQAIADAINAGRATIEIAMTDHGNFVHNGGIFCVGNTSRGFWMYQSFWNSTRGIVLSYHAKMTDEYKSYTVRAGENAGTWTAVLGADSASSCLAKNGTVLIGEDAQTNLTRYSTDVADDNCYIGVLPGNWLSQKIKGTAEVYSIRVYGKVLNEDELARNRQLDQYRFLDNLVMSEMVCPSRPLVVKKAYWDENRVPTGADLTFEGSGQVRELYVVWGNVDRGTDVPAWGNNIVKVCDIPAATFERSVTLPQNVRSKLTDRSGVRYLIKTDKEFLADAYIAPDHLIAQWDGIENAGYGQHDASLACPTELTGEIEQELVGTMACGPRHFTLGSGYLHFNSQKLADAINAGSATVEMVMCGLGALVNNGGIFCVGDKSRGFWMYQQKEFISAISYHAKMTGEYSDVPTTTGTTTNTFSVVLSTDATTMRRYRNNTDAYGFKRFSTDLTDDNCYIGVLPGTYLASSLKALANVFSIRVYDKVLSSDELSYNYRLDAYRFSNGGGCFAASHITPFIKRGGCIILIQ